MSERPVLSYTRLSTYLDCPMKYKYQYEDKYKKKENINFLMGDAIHKALEFNDNHYIKNKCHLPVGEVVNVYNNIMRRRISELLIIDYKPELEIVSVVQAVNFLKGIYNDHLNELIEIEIKLHDALVIGEKMLMAYMDHLQTRHNYQPKVMEQAFEVSLATAPVQFRGFIDQITEDGFIVDRKTSKSEYKVLKGTNGKPVINPSTGNFIFDGEPQKKLQLIMYALWFRKTYGKKERGLQYDVITKHKNPRVQLLDIIVTEAEIEEAIQLMEKVTNKIVNKEFPTNPSFACRWCEFKDQCPAQRGWYGTPGANTDPIIFE